jgi:hypothetical protein
MKDVWNGYEFTPQIYKVEKVNVSINAKSYDNSKGWWYG